jgi:hypothetical protein
MVNNKSLTDNEAAQLIARLDYIRKHPDESFIEDRNGNVTPIKELRPLRRREERTDGVIESELDGGPTGSPRHPSCNDTTNDSLSKPCHPTMGQNSEQTD